MAFWMLNWPFFKFLRRFQACPAYFKPFGCQSNYFVLFCTDLDFLWKAIVVEVMTNIMTVTIVVRVWWSLCFFDTNWRSSRGRVLQIIQRTKGFILELIRLLHMFVSVSLCRHDGSSHYANQQVRFHFGTKGRVGRELTWKRTCTLSEDGRVKTFYITKAENQMRGLFVACFWFVARRILIGWIMHVQRQLSFVLSGTYPDVHVHLLKHVGFARLANGFLSH